MPPQEKFVNAGDNQVVQIIDGKASVMTVRQLKARQAMLTRELAAIGRALAFARAEGMPDDE
jgi:hypothetical protein